MDQFPVLSAGHKFYATIKNLVNPMEISQNKTHKTATNPKSSPFLVGFLRSFTAIHRASTPTSPCQGDAVLAPRRSPDGCDVS